MRRGRCIIVACISYFGRLSPPRASAGMGRVRCQCSGLVTFVARSPTADVVSWLVVPRSNIPRPVSVVKTPVGEGEWGERELGRGCEDGPGIASPGSAQPVSPGSPLTRVLEAQRPSGRPFYLERV